MKKYLILILLINTIPPSVFAQNKSFFTVGMEISSPNTKKYFYNTNQYEINNIDIYKRETGFNFTYGINLSYNYMIFKRLSIGAISGYHNDVKQNFAHLRFGVNTKYYYINNKLYNFNLQLADNLSLNTKKFKSGVNVRLGIEFPLFNIKNKTILTSLFWEQNYYKLDNCNKLLNLNDEKPRSLTNHLIGISIGIKL